MFLLSSNRNGSDESCDLFVREANNPEMALVELMKLSTSFSILSFSTDSCKAIMSKISEMRIRADKQLTLGFRVFLRSFFRRDWKAAGILLTCGFLDRTGSVLMILSVTLVKKLILNEGLSDRK
jgi:hypothetical protein